MDMGWLNDFRIGRDDFLLLAGRRGLRNCSGLDVFVKVFTLCFGKNVVGDQFGIKGETVLMCNESQAA